MEQVGKLFRPSLAYLFPPSPLPSLLLFLEESPFLHYPLSRPLRSRPLKSSYMVWGAPQPTNDLVHFSFKIWHLVATSLVIFVITNYQMSCSLNSIKSKSGPCVLCSKQNFSLLWNCKYNSSKIATLPKWWKTKMLAKIWTAVCQLKLSYAEYWRVCCVLCHCYVSPKTIDNTLSVLLLHEQLRKKLSDSTFIHLCVQTGTVSTSNSNFLNSWVTTAP